MMVTNDLYPIPKHTLWEGLPACMCVFMLGKDTSLSSGWTDSFLAAQSRQKFSVTGNIETDHQKNGYSAHGAYLSIDL